MSLHSDAQDASQGRLSRAALVVAHPGHELRVHGWLEATRPSVCVLTDGSGRTGSSRLGSTTRVLDEAAARPGPVYGAMSDGDLYAAVLDHEHSPFLRLVEELASMVVHDRVEILVGDAEEGYNPTHDICRLLVDATVRLVGRTTTARIANYDFALVGPPDHCHEALRSRSIRLALDEAAFARKLSAALNYPELRSEVEAALSGAYDLRVECLRPVVDRDYAAAAPHNGRFYEDYGERQVQAGHYERVLRYREHVLPLALALDAHVEKLS